MQGKTRGIVIRISILEDSQSSSYRKFRMCNVEDDGLLKPLQTNKSTPGSACVKCGEPGILIIRIHDSFCKNCFQVYVVHRFRAAIGKSKLIRDGEHVLVAYSGGANSSALLHLIQDGLSERAHKKLRFIPTLLHVDECSILPLQEEEHQQLLQKVCTLMTNTGIPSFLTKLELGLALTRTNENSEPATDPSLVWSVQDGTVPNCDTKATLKEKLKSVLNNLASASSKEDFIRNLRNQLLVCIARQMGFTKIITAECSTRLGVRILTDVAQGRGSQLALNTGFSDNRNGDVMFVRPVRDLNVKELTMLNTLFGVDSVFIPCITTKGQTLASIEHLTETFVTGLQADYQSTVPNIVKTSEKLGLPNSESTKCLLCQSPLDTDVGSASALSAVEFSLKLAQSGGISQSAPSCEGKSLTNDVSSGCCGQGDSSCKSKSAANLRAEDVMEHLCYGCRLSLRSYDGAMESLPPFVANQAEIAKQRKIMKEEIADFLLEDDDDS